MTGPVQMLGHAAIAGAVHAATGTVGEQDQGTGAGGKDELAGKSHSAHVEDEGPPPVPAVGSNGEEFCHQVIGGGREVTVEDADRSEVTGGADAHHLVGTPEQVPAGLGRGHGSGHDDTAGAVGAGHPTGRLGGGAGGDAVVDDDRQPPFEAEHRAAAPIGPGPPPQLHQLLLSHLVEGGGADSQR